MKKTFIIGFVLLFLYAVVISYLHFSSEDETFVYDPMNNPKIQKAINQAVEKITSLYKDIEARDKVIEVLENEVDSLHNEINKSKSGIKESKAYYETKKKKIKSLVGLELESEINRIISEESDFVPVIKPFKYLGGEDFATTTPYVQMFATTVYDRQFFQESYRKCLRQNSWYEEIVILQEEQLEESKKNRKSLTEIIKAKNELINELLQPVEIETDAIVGELEAGIGTYYDFTAENSDKFLKDLNYYGYVEGNLIFEKHISLGTQTKIRKVANKDKIGLEQHIKAGYKF